MATQKISKISTVRLNNLEFVNFFTRFRTLVTAEQGAVGLSADDDSPSSGSGTTPRTVIAVDGTLVNALDADLRTMNDIAYQSRTSQETAQLEALDQQRDRAVLCVNAVVSGFLYSEEEAKLAAATHLANVLKPYVGIQTLPYGQETAAVNGMLADLGGEAYSHVTTLGLQSSVERLRALNNAYASLVEQRTQSRQSRDLEDAKAVRARLMETYDAICAGVYVDNMRDPTTLTRQFIDDVNALVAETNAAYKLRVAQQAAAKARQEPGAAPEA